MREGDRTLLASERMKVSSRLRFIGLRIPLLAQNSRVSESRRYNASALSQNYLALIDHKADVQAVPANVLEDPDQAGGVAVLRSQPVGLQLSRDLRADQQVRFR